MHRNVVIWNYFCVDIARKYLAMAYPHCVEFWPIIVQKVLIRILFWGCCTCFMTNIGLFRIITRHIIIVGIVIWSIYHMLLVMEMNQSCIWTFVLICLRLWSGIGRYWVIHMSYMILYTSHSRAVNPGSGLHAAIHKSNDVSYFTRQFSAWSTDCCQPRKKSQKFVSLTICAPNPADR